MIALLRPLICDPPIDKEAGKDLSRETRSSRFAEGLREPLRIFARPLISELAIDKEAGSDLRSETWCTRLEAEAKRPVKILNRPFVSEEATDNEPVKVFPIPLTWELARLSEAGKVLKRELCSTPSEDEPNKPVKILTRLLVPEPARDNELLKTCA